jgi:hypothetical protein
MKYKKIEINEIIDDNGDLIGASAIPSSGTDLESQANGITDKNVKISHQPFRYDMLGRFGFTLLPFMESVIKEDEEVGLREKNADNELLTALAKLMYEKYRELLEYFYKHPKQLQQDYRKKTRDHITFETDEEAGIKTDYEWANRILKTIEPFLDKELSKLNEALKDDIVESAFIEGKMLEKKSETELSKKGDSREVREKKMEKIAGLINKLEKKDIDTLINLLERK